jgi:hypothetical protein
MSVICDHDLSPLPDTLQIAAQLSPQLSYADLDSRTGIALVSSYLHSIIIAISRE